MPEMDAFGNNGVIFRLTRFWRLVLSFFCVVGALVFVAVPAAWIIRSPQWTPMQCALLALGIGVAVFTFWGVSKIGRYQIEIHPGLIRYQGAFRVTELNFEDIAGYRILPTQYIQTLLITPKNKAHKKIQIGLTYERKSELLAWLAGNLKDLDHEEQISELADITMDPNLGFTKEHRLARLGSAKKCTKILTLVSFAAMALGFFRPDPYPVILGLLLILPALALLILLWFPGLVHFDGKKNSAYPNVAAAFMMPGLVLTLRAILDWHVVEWNGLWAPFITIGLMLTAAVYVCAKDVRKKPGKALIAACFAFPYAYGALIYFNCYYDRSEPLVYNSIVRDRHVSHGKHTSYHLTLDPFIDNTPEREVDVPRSIYEQHEVGDAVRIYVFEGTLSIPWYFVR
jgi:hypothetical protein